MDDRDLKWAPHALASKCQLASSAPFGLESEYIQLLPITANGPGGLWEVWHTDHWTRHAMNLPNIQQQRDSTLGHERLPERLLGVCEVEELNQTAKSRGIPTAKPRG